MAHTATLTPITVKGQTYDKRIGFKLLSDTMSVEEITDTLDCCGDQLHTIAILINREGFDAVELSITAPRTVQVVRGIFV